MSTSAATRRTRDLITLSRFRVDDAGHLAGLEEALGRARRDQMHGPGDYAGPPGLVTRPQAGPVVAVEILVEQDEIAPVWILLKLPGASIHRPSASGVS